MYDRAQLSTITHNLCTVQEYPFFAVPRVVLGYKVGLFVGGTEGLMHHDYIYYKIRTISSGFGLTFLHVHSCLLRAQLLSYLYIYIQNVQYNEW